MINPVFLFMCAASERMDVKDRGRCDNTAEAGLSAAASQELLTVAGVLADLAHRYQRALHCPIMSVVAQSSFCKIIVGLQRPTAAVSV